MATISSGAQKMNRFLQQRRQKLNKLKNFRKQRIIKHYHKAKQSYEKSLQQHKIKSQAKCQDAKQEQIDPEKQRKINFYNQVFNEPHVNERLEKNKRNKNKKNKGKGQGNGQGNLKEEKDQKTIANERLHKLKDKKVKLIKKMKTQKTPRGQPVMRNMIQYALTKIEESIQKDKIQKLNQDQLAKQNSQNNRNQSNQPRR